MSPRWELFTRKPSWGVAGTYALYKFFTMLSHVVFKSPFSCAVGNICPEVLTNCWYSDNEAMHNSKIHAKVHHHWSTRKVTSARICNYITSSVGRCSGMHHSVFCAVTRRSPGAIVRCELHLCKQRFMNTGQHVPHGRVLGDSCVLARFWPAPRWSTAQCRQNWPKPVVRLAFCQVE